MQSAVTAVAAGQLWVALAQAQTKDLQDCALRTGVHLPWCEHASLVEAGPHYRKGVGVGSVGTVLLIFQNILLFQKIIIFPLSIYDTLMNLMTMKLSLCAFN